MKNSLAMLSALIAMGASNERKWKGLNDDKKTYGTPVFEEEVKVMTEDERQLKKGLKKFEYLNGSVYALNQKNADRKAKKLNLK